MKKRRISGEITEKTPVPELLKKAEKLQQLSELAKAAWTVFAAEFPRSCVRCTNRATPLGELKAEAKCSCAATGNLVSIAKVANRPGGCDDYRGPRLRIF